jgi:hypothetical protein
MSRFGAAFLAASVLAAIPAAAAEQVPHKVVGEAAWGCRDKSDVIELLFQGMSVSYDGKLTSAIAAGRCVAFVPGEDVVIVDPGANGIVKVARPGASPVAYWTAVRNLN